MRRPIEALLAMTIHEMFSVDDCIWANRLILFSFYQARINFFSTTSYLLLPPGVYCDIPLGMYIVRGDNIVLLGEIDPIKEEQMPLQKVSPEELTEIAAVAGGNGQSISWDLE